MKKLILLTATLVFGLSATNAQGFNFGPKGGFNIASIYGYEASNSRSAKAGFNIGGVARIEISDQFSLQPELAYSTQGTNVNDVTARFNYLVVPIMADYTLFDGFSVQAGPQFGINLTAKLGGRNANFRNIPQREDRNIIEFGIGAGAQYSLPMGLFFQARHVLGLTQIGKGQGIKNSVLSFSVGYLFL